MLAKKVLRQEQRSVTSALLGPTDTDQPTDQQTNQQTNMIVHREVKLPKANRQQTFFSDSESPSPEIVIIN